MSGRLATVVRAHASQRGVGLVCLFGALLSGCAGHDPVQEQWASRDSLPACGSLDLRQGDPRAVPGTEEHVCLRRAFGSDRGVELTVRYLTVEGDPITKYFRVLPDGTTEVYTDSTQDEFGDEAWSHRSCDQPESALDVAC